MRHRYEHNFTYNKKLIVGEGDSDLRFLRAFCVKNMIEGFEFAFTGMHATKDNGGYAEGGFENFGKYLTSVSKTVPFPSVTDYVLGRVDEFNQA